jgi:hypothetical protein
MMRRLWVGAAISLLAACAPVERAPAPVLVPAEKVEEAPLAESPKFKSDTLRYLSKRMIKPQPTRPLNVRSNCSHKDDIGTVTKLDLLVKDAEVKTFSAQVTMKGYGTCRFNLKDFEQAEKLPQALLKHKSETACSVRMWEQGSKVTIAFNSCPKSCDGDAFSYLWPIMLENPSGRCF